MKTSMRPHHIEEAKCLRNNGLSWAEIARRLPYSADTICRALTEKRVYGGLSVKKNIRFTVEQFAVIKKNGGPKWIRELIDQAIARES